MKRILGWLSRRGGTPLAGLRWVVIDTETSGLDPGHDRLLSIGAVAVRAGRIELADAYTTVVGQAAPSDPRNIAVHGIGGDAQLAGMPRPEALRGLEAFIGEGVPVAFNAAFDAAMLGRAIDTDLALIAPALDPARGRSCRTLDDWLAAYGIEAHARHDALGDAYATAQFLLVVLAQAAEQRIGTVESLRRIARERRWIST